MILFTTAFDFFAARAIEASDNPEVRKRWVTLSVCVELGVLGLFKYFGFFLEELNRLLGALRLEHWEPGLQLILPVGISFYTFQALSYTIDVYRGKTKPCGSFLDFALYISFFPQLVAGPIERSHRLLPQIENPRPPLSESRFRDGLFLVMTGLFLKVVVADNMAWLATDLFSRDSELLSASDVLVGLYAFSFQIYGDFAGYSAIAIGSAKWLGFDLMENFRRPYFSSNPSEFWQRWHISLSTWLRDYLYIPLGGNRNGRFRTYRNLILTMLLGGIWHGAAWTFLVWGAIHGVWLAIHRAIIPRRKGNTSAPGRSWFLRTCCIIGTFHLVCIAWLFFRADSIEQAIELLATIGGEWKMTEYAQTGLSLIFFFVGPWMLFDFWTERKGNSLAVLERPWVVRAGLYGYIAVMLLFFPAPASVEFIYFQF